ncbi:unnamed protein product [Rotaria magnacalcarata]|uniref:Uncharacterized protein n=2 Tax=Rotaria magnacalcarata TaxID=392030 RepID=A0A816W3R4_9BILA|nr:unnamed protein product [Rotaria magnacalcarata]CAF3950567.1 unnamed protein product [Rotaria magnacalcarata]CAF4010093.1 unnamed protein product [Rotaria magnacalcarata]
MAVNSLTHIGASDKNKNIEYKLNLFEPQADGDWTKAIHHELNIKRRTCTTFIPNLSATSEGNANDIPCGCKRLRREHSWDATVGNDSKWDRKKHTKSAYNNAYGYIPSTHAHYIRCDIETQPKILASLIYDVWETKEPKLIMCIIGGAKYFKLNERLEREFIKGIIQAALRADGWIVTTGFKTGVVQLVGEAIHDHKVTNPRSSIVAIGCSKWGAAKHRESLILKNISKKSNLDVAMRKAKNTKGEQELEPNHTHFLLLDDGTYYGYDIGDYRTRFVIEASCYKNEDVPVVTVVVEGGPDTLITIYKDLSNGIPVILIDGSGRVPNLLANFLTRTESMINRSVKDDSGTNWKQVIDIKEPDHVEKLKTKFHSYEDEIYDGLKEISKGSKTSKEEMDRLFKYFLYCLQPAVRSKIRIYSLDSDQPLDDTIFEAIIEAKQEKSLEKNTAVDREQLLNLALAWNAIEVAKDHIIKDDLNDLSSAVKEKLFLEALMLDRPHFVNTFIKLNFDLAQIFYQKKINQPWELKWHQLEKLYKYDDKKNRERLYLLSKCYDNKPITSREDLDIILKDLIGDYVKSIYTAASSSLWERFRIYCRLSTARVSDSRTTLCRDYIDDDSEVPDPEEAQKEVREYVYRDLFFWSILTNRIEMSKVIISHMQTRICAALIASKVLKSFKDFATDNESKEVLHSQAEQFEQYAIESLKCCYNYDEEKACEIAIRRIYLFGGVSCLQVAVDADDKDFVGQPCCDQLLNNIWFDKMKPFQFTLRERGQVLLSIFTFGLLAPVLIKFRENKSDSANFDNDRKKNYEMTVNETEQDEKSLLRKTTRSLIRIGPYILFYIGLILRFTYASTDGELSAAKIIFAYDLEIWYIRSLSFLGVARKMGPKIVMIQKMLIDLFFFIYIILIAMIGYGVASRSMYSFDDPTQNDYLTFDGRSIFRHILYPTYYLMYGSTDSEKAALDQNPDYSTSIATQVLLAFHMLFVNVLLINLLIAMFSYTFNAVQTQTDLVWRYDRYGLVREYFDRPPFFPPFIIITHIVEFAKLISRHVPNVDHSKMRRRRTKIFKMIAANREIDKEWSEFESYATNLYARTIVSGQPSSAAALVPSAARQEIPQTMLDTMNTSLASPNVDIKAITDEIASIKRSVGDLRTYAEEMNRCMQWMMDAMERVKMSKEPKPKLRSSRTTTDLKPSDE